MLPVTPTSTFLPRSAKRLVFKIFFYFPKHQFIVQKLLCCQVGGFGHTLVKAGDFNLFPVLKHFFQVVNRRGKLG